MAPRQPKHGLSRTATSQRDAALPSRQQLTDVQSRFIAAWGQMGAAWGVSRTMAEVYALLYITGHELNTDDVMDRLSISRGNASMSLRSLVEWGIVQRVHKRGERKEYFLAEQDVWALSRKVMRERLRREILPLLTTLYELRDQTTEHQNTMSAADASTNPARERGADSGQGRGAPSSGLMSPPSLPMVTEEEVRAHNERLDALLDLVQTIDRLGERFVGADGKGLRLAASVLSKIV